MDNKPGLCSSSTRTPFSVSTVGWEEGHDGPYVCVESFGTGTLQSDRPVITPTKLMVNLTLGKVSIHSLSVSLRVTEV